MENEISREEFNGLGRRVSGVEQLNPRVERNEEDIQKIFDALSSLPYKVLGMISIPCILLIIQMYLNVTGKK